jgi:glycerol-3-phosphate dehydrogenase (NAD(P)+)
VKQVDVAVLGAGSFGTCLAIHLAKLGRNTVLWARNPDLVENIRKHGHHPTRYPHIPIPLGLKVTHELTTALSAPLLIHAIPTQHTRSFWSGKQATIGDDTRILLAAKGLEQATGDRLDEIFSQLFDSQWVTTHLAALSGPTFAAEIAAGVPSVALVAALDERLAETFQTLLASPDFRIYSSLDLIGVEVAGAFKNVIAIAAGAGDGMGLGLNTRAAIIARGLAEMTRFGVAQGADPATFSGLAGVGDLVLTATGDLSRNRTVGMRLGKGDTLDDVLKDMREIAEGVPTTASVVTRAKMLGIEIPIAEQIYEVLFNRKDPKVAMHELMTRALKREN